MNYQENLFDLLEKQKESWPLLKSNSLSLSYAKEKEFNFNGYSMKVQFNPERITSSAAKVDKKSIEERPCFLCEKNRPSQQASVSFDSDFELLCNPFPIFPMHFTLSHKDHIPQEIKNSFHSFLELSRALPDLVVFYNAPNCGASAPDHLHFQAGNIGFLPIENDFETLNNTYGQTVVNNVFLKVRAIDDGLRRFLVLESENKTDLVDCFKEIYNLFVGNNKNEEPMLNILSYYKDAWRIFVFLREKHRPSQYFETGDKNILLSPASVDYGGTLITPMEKDFIKITSSDIRNIFGQVSISSEKFKSLINRFSSI